MIEAKAFNIAVLAACYNRKQKTIAFLESLISQNYFKRLLPDIYLLDDASTDGTADAVNTKYPQINIVHGDGNLFWAGGMRTVWKYAIEQKTYDLFLLFNDDVILFENAFEKLIKVYENIAGSGIVLIGSTVDPDTHKITYGGNRLIMHRFKTTEYSLIKPDDNKPVPCQIGNANILLVDKATVDKIGIFSDAYVHSMADFDYTYSAHKAGINVLIAPGYYGYCEYDHGVNWLPGNEPLKKRIKYLYHPKGLAYKQYLYFVKKHFPSSYYAAFVKLWMKTLFPVIWDKFKKRER